MPNGQRECPNNESIQCIEASVTYIRESNNEVKKSFGFTFFSVATLAAQEVQTADMIANCHDDNKRNVSVIDEEMGHSIVVSGCEVSTIIKNPDGSDAKIKETKVVAAGLPLSWPLFAERNIDGKETLSCRLTSFRK